MKNKELMMYLEILKEMDSLELGVKFGYAVAKNFERVQKSADALQKTLNKRPDGWKDYEKARQHIFDDVAEKDEQGMPIKTTLPGGQGFEYKIIKWGLLDKKLEELRNDERFKAMVDEQEAKTKELEELMEQEAEKFEWFGVKAKYVPKTMKAKFYRVLINMVPENEINDLPDPEEKK
jgi:hypothetical protein